MNRKTWPPIPEIGTPLFCLVCAYKKPWGIWHSATGVTVCVDCRDRARAPWGRDD